MPLEVVAAERARSMNAWMTALEEDKGGKKGKQRKELISRVSEIDLYISCAKRVDMRTKDFVMREEPFSIIADDFRKVMSCAAKYAI